MAIELDALGMTELLQLQTQISDALHRRFERRLALLSSDVVGSTAYFARFGDVAGRAIQQLHLDLLHEALAAHDGHIVDVAGDGAVSICTSAEEAVAAVVSFEEHLAQANRGRAREHQLSVRIGIHFGPVLSDGVVVSGDAVKLCSYVAASCKAGEVRLTKTTFTELSKEHRLRCRAVPPLTVPGGGEPVELLQLEWQDSSLFPVRVKVRETGEVIPLPIRDTISFGRLREQNGIPANDIVLALGDKTLTQQISRWQFELKRMPQGFILRSVTDQLTEVDGVALAKGQETPIRPGVLVRVAKVLTLEFQAEEQNAALDTSNATMMGRTPLG